MTPTDSERILHPPSTTSPARRQGRLHRAGQPVSDRVCRAGARGRPDAGLGQEGDGSDREVDGRREYWGSSILAARLLGGRYETQTG